jgi:hypothetical protein
MNDQLIKLFKMGMDRSIMEPLPPSHWPIGPVLNVGAGYKVIRDSVSLDLPEWDADNDPIPYDDGTVAGIHAYHFLEHVANVPRMMMEFQRVLMPLGVVNIVVPYYTSQMQAHDLTHKNVFCEETWRNLFACDYYDRYDKDGEPFKWKFSVCTNVIMGVVERNLALVTQLIKYA